MNIKDVVTLDDNEYKVASKVNYEGRTIII